jgi:hypothetical protein
MGFCKIATNSIMHYIWQCPKVQEFWQQVGRWLEEIFEFNNFDHFSSCFIKSSVIIAVYFSTFSLLFSLAFKSSVVGK